jgi:hypothetical protein
VSGLGLGVRFVISLLLDKSLPIKGTPIFLSFVKKWEAHLRY